MSEEIFYPIEEAEKLVSRFMNCTLPADEWDHGGHLVMGLYMHAKHGDTAYAEIKNHLLQYVKSLGKDGYHETMTRFWLWAIRHFRKEIEGGLEWTQSNLDDLIFDENLTRRNLWQDFYSEELMMSNEAKQEFLQPDKKPFL